ncbi:hypothetical protein [Paracoccus sp. NSM]|uniref:hypothetical protein n=1 Tax=Paracoccus sp. NSM TaxID=3457784 RepID=UPI0040354830
MNDLDDDGLAAAEYVLGVADMADRAAFEARMRASPALRALVAEWETRLAGMNAAFSPMPAPDMLPLIEARLFGVATQKTMRQRAASLLKALAQPRVAVPVGVVLAIKAAVIWLLFLR